MIKLPKTKFIGIFDINTLIKPKNSLTVQALTSALYNNSKHVNLFTVELIKKYEGLPIKNVVNIVSKILNLDIKTEQYLFKKTNENLYSFSKNIKFCTIDKQFISVLPLLKSLNLKYSIVSSNFENEITYNICDNFHKQGFFPDFVVENNITENKDEISLVKKFYRVSNEDVLFKVCSNSYDIKSLMYSNVISIGYSQQANQKLDFYKNGAYYVYSNHHILKDILITENNNKYKNLLLFITI